ncbi:MAG: S46 family peptidase [Alphaproteobacteria bacterium]|nr:S46 family peptidase [Alphaproteobacteria bacterium]
MKALLRSAGALGLLLAAPFVAPAQAEEGMWTFDNFPSDEVREAYGWAPDQAWLDRVRLGSVRLEGGCSASIVGAEGLVQTNHHCVVDCVQNFSSPGENVVLTGVRAMSRAEERRCEGMAAQVLMNITDVTQRIEGATADVDAQGFTRARDAEISRIESECRGEAADKRCQVVTLYQGGQYKLYEYKRFEDVRLVFAPELNAAFFGGDPDNFNFPRYCLDVAFLRLYENDRPARTPNRLQWRSDPLRDGELVFISGNPGSTSRQLTAAQLAFQRDHFLPWRLSYLSELRGRLIAYSAQGPEQARIASDTLFGVENAFKALTGRRLALADPQGFGVVEAREANLLQSVASSADTSQTLSAAYGDIAEATQTFRGFYLAHQFAEVRLGGGSELMSWARDLVRAGDERAKPNAERLPAYTDARIGSVRQRVLAETPVEGALDEILISFWLSKMREYLTADDPLVRKVLGEESPEALAHRLVSQTRLGDPAFRAQLWEGGAAAIAASDDPLIVFIRGWDADARALRARNLQEVEGPVARAQERIAQARFQQYGQSLYPDATFTLRLSYGRIAGWTEPGGREVAPFTTISGLYERGTGADPFAITQSWLDARPRLNPNTIFNVSTTNDIIGGNSGSPLLDRGGRVVGAVFDGNIHSLGGEYFYDGRLNRSVAVASTAVEEALGTVYGMNHIVRELRR